MNNNTPSKEYIDYICDLYGEPYDDRLEDTRPPVAHDIDRIPGYQWVPGKKATHKSLSAFQNQLKDMGINLSTSKIRKILISGDCWSTERSRQINRLFNEYTSSIEENGMGLSSNEAIKRIARELGVSVVTISVNLPYLNVVYNLNDKSSNAKRCDKYREKKASIADQSEITINELYKQAKRIVPQLNTSMCIVNGDFFTLEEMEQMGYDEFWKRSKINMPRKLYKYYSNKEEITENEETVNYSMESLMNNTVYMQSPSNFDDVYDSDVHIEYLDFLKFRFLEYCKRCLLDVDETNTVEELGNAFLQSIINSYNEYKDLNHIFKRKPQNEFERLSNEIIINKLLLYSNDNETDIVSIINRIMEDEFNDFKKSLQDSFRVSCFATTPYSQLMWGGTYADCHKGFCVEYTVDLEDEKYQNLVYNLFPLIYCKSRPNITKDIMSFADTIDKDTLWNIYFHGALRKSIDWAFQNEWRLLLPLNKNRGDDFNIEFFPITKVYLGNRMPYDKRKNIIDYCNSKGIPYIGVKRKPDMFEMQECVIKCEDCPEFRK